MGPSGKRCIVTAAAWLSLGCAPAAAGVATRPEPTRAAARDHHTTAEQNLVAFARLYGYVRFFHPTDAAHEADWRGLAVLGVERVRDAATVDELHGSLASLFMPLAPTMQLWVHGEPPPRRPRAPRPVDGLVYWQYQGFPGSPLPRFTPPYAKVRVLPTQTWKRRFSEAPRRDARVETELLRDLHVRLPIVLSARQAEGAPPTLAPLSEADPDRDLHELAVRQAAVIEVWNVLRHFYPYQRELSLDWDAMLVAALRSAADDASPDDFRATLRRLVGPLQDGHGFVGHRGLTNDITLPIRIEIVEGHAVVTGTREPDRFAVGDIVEHIDGEPATERIYGIAAELSGTPQWRELRASLWESTRTHFGGRRLLRLRRPSGEVYDAEAEASRDPVPINPRPPSIHTYDDGVMYIDLTRAEWDEIEVVVPQLAEAPGVVFDMRGYPRDNEAILDHLLREPEDTKWMHVPRYVEPDGAVAGWHDIGWRRRPRTPNIAAPVVFLTSAEAISYAESMMSYVEAHDLGTIVGTTTAGANGDIVRFDTLAGFYIIYSGMRVTRHDGSDFHRTGVAPDIEVRPTIAGLAAGQDEVLERGLTEVRSGVAATRVARRPSTAR